MKIAIHTSALLVAATLTLAGCTPKEKAPSPTPAPTATPDPVAKPASKPAAVEVTEIPLADVPEQVTLMVTAAYPGFTPVEVLKKVRDGRTYFDVEGELKGGDEIEFDVLMTSAGPEIVEIQRDISPRLLPTNVRNILDEANVDGLEIARVIESVQTNDNSIIYEIFVAGKPAHPTFEVQVSGEEAVLLEERAEH